MMNTNKWLGIATSALVLTFGSTSAMAGTRAGDSKAVYAVAKSSSSNLVSALQRSEGLKNGFSEKPGMGDKKDKKGRKHKDHGKGDGNGHDHHDHNKSNGC